MRISTSRRIFAASPPVNAMADEDTARPPPIDDIAPPPLWLAVLRTLCRLAVIALVAFTIHALSAWLMAQVGTMPVAWQTPVTVAMVAALLASYTLLLALPFVPGVEIGIALLMARGAEAAPLVYLATVCGLMLAFIAGRHVPPHAIRAVFRDLHMRRACELIDKIEPLDPPARLARLRANLPDWLGRRLTRWRYPAVGLLLNLPGNALIGGGGGIMLLAGVSGLFAPWQAALTVALAVAPVPLAVMILGPAILG